MDQLELEQAVAAATGESLTTIKHLGFELVRDQPRHGNSACQAGDESRDDDDFHQREAG